jgi:RNA polymerase sigma factor (sigma-70 family)
MPFEPWIYAIASHVAAAAFRKRRPLSNTEEVESALDVTSPSPCEQVQQTEEEERLRWCLQQLNKRERQVIDLSRDALGQFQGNEIAQALRISASTVCRRLERALESLRRCLAHRSPSSGTVPAGEQ